MNTIEVKNENADLAIKAAHGGAGMAEVLSILLDRKVKVGPAIERIFSFEDACADRGYQPDDPRFTDGTLDQNAYLMLTLVIIPSLNPPGWKADWNDDDQEKWWASFWMNDPGFRLDDVYCDFSASHWTGGSRLCVASEEIMRHLIKYFLPVLRDFYC